MSGQEDPTIWISFPFPTAPWSRILRHSPAQQCLSPGWNISPSSLPAQSWLCFIHHMPLFPGMKFPDPGSSQPSAAPTCCFPEKKVGVDTRRQGHSTAGAAAALRSRGLQHLFSLEFGEKDPINAVGQFLGEALWHPATSHCNSSIRLDILKSSAGVVKPFPYFSSFFVSLCSGH